MMIVELFVEINARSYCLQFLLNLQVQKKCLGMKMKLKRNKRTLVNHNWNRFRELFSYSGDERVVLANSSINKQFVRISWTNLF